MGEVTKAVILLGGPQKGMKKDLLHYCFGNINAQQNFFVTWFCSRALFS